MVKKLLANAGEVTDLYLIPGLGRSPGGGNRKLPQYSFLENPADKGAWWATVYGATESDTTEGNTHTHS